MLAKEPKQKEKDIAFFATLGQPLGISFLIPPDLTLITTKSGIGMTLSKELVLYSDFLFLPPDNSKVKATQIGEMYFTYNFNMGVGLRLSSDKKQRLGIRFPLFFNWGDHQKYKNKRTPLLVYEITPVLILMDEAKLILDGYIGFHLPF
ncbi:hypothetical protein KAI68_01175 [bacterium]|nr:hypothetical protein [bacterium]